MKKNLLKLLVLILLAVVVATVIAVTSGEGLNDTSVGNGTQDIIRLL